MTDDENPAILLLKARMLLKRHIDEKGCWIWTGTKDREGRGLIKVNGVRVQVHRLAVAVWRGIVVQQSQVVQRICFNPSCFNPAHLEVCTRKELRKAVRCLNGHLLLNEDSYVVQNGLRHCRTCLASLNPPEDRGSNKA